MKCGWIDLPYWLRELLVWRGAHSNSGRIIANKSGKQGLEWFLSSSIPLGQTWISSTRYSAPVVVSWKDSMKSTPHPHPHLLSWNLEAPQSCPLPFSAPSAIVLLLVLKLVSGPWLGPSPLSLHPRADFIIQCRHSALGLQYLQRLNKIFPF